MSWIEIRDKTRLWCKIDPRRCLIEIVNRGIKKVIDLTAYGLIYVGLPEDGADNEMDENHLDFG